MLFRSHVTPVIDGAVTSYFEWLGAGLYRVDERSGAMHGKKFLVKELLYGSDAENLYVRLDFTPGAEEALASLDARLTLQAGGRASTAVIRLDQGRAATAVETAFAAEAASGPPLECAYGGVLEVRVSLAALGAPDGGKVRFQLSLWQGGLPVDALPQQGWLELVTGDNGEWFV